MEINGHFHDSAALPRGMGQSIPKRIA